MQAYPISQELPSRLLCFVFLLEIQSNCTSSSTLKNLLCVAVHVYTSMYGCIHAMARVWKPEDKWKELVLSCTFWGQNLGLQALWQIPLPTKQSHWPSPTVCVRINGLSENYQIIYRSWYPPEMEGITLLLNMPLVLVAGHKEIELELSWE